MQWEQEFFQFCLFLPLFRALPQNRPLSVKPFHSPLTPAPMHRVSHPGSYLLVSETKRGYLLAGCKCGDSRKAAMLSHNSTGEDLSGNGLPPNLQY